MTYQCAACTRDSIDCDCFGGAIHQCANCKLEPSFPGWSDCIRCGTAVLRIEHPDYPTFARKHLDYTAAELEQLDEEWARQSVTVEAA